MIPRYIKAYIVIPCTPEVIEAKSIFYDKASYNVLIFEPVHTHLEYAIHTYLCLKLFIGLCNEVLPIKVVHVWYSNAELDALIPATGPRPTNSPVGDDTAA